MSAAAALTPFLRLPQHITPGNPTIAPADSNVTFPDTNSLSPSSTDPHPRAT